MGSQRPGVRSAWNVDEPLNSCQGMGSQLVELQGYLEAHSSEHSGDELQEVEVCGPDAALPSPLPPGGRALPAEL
ncbi:unnamed protein product [Eretmochelys imbricata]